MLIRDFVVGLTRLVYPPQCWVCRQLVETNHVSLCEPCHRELTTDSANVCPHCAATVGPHTDVREHCVKCRTETFAFASARRLGEYREGAIVDAVLAIKHLEAESLASILGGLWSEKHSDIRSCVDCVIPIPLHWLRSWQRGYNQSAEVASAISERLQIPCETRTLFRHRITPTQIGQSAAARRENVRGAFRLARTASVKGRRILLIDDVMTTGATLDEAARVLMEGGAANVHVGIIGRRM